MSSSYDRFVISYRTGNDIDLDEMIGLYVDSTLGERRPVGERDRMARMLDEANLVITAWDDELLVGISRSVTDWVYCTYLSDLAVRADYQGQGIGKELVRLTREATPQATIILLAAPKAVDYYPKIGMTRHESAWILRPGEEPT
jgi:GNAT superfamily N-acetyltransferase